MKIVKRCSKYSKCVYLSCEATWHRETFWVVMVFKYLTVYNRLDFIFTALTLVYIFRPKKGIANFYEKNLDPFFLVVSKSTKSLSFFLRRKMLLLYH